MVEIEVATGNWQYECLAERVPVLQRPMLSLAGKPAKGKEMVLCLREVVQIQEKVRPLNGKGSFLRLADGRGWALDFIDGQQVLKRQPMIGEHSYGGPEADSSPSSPPGFGSNTFDSHNATSAGFKGIPFSTWGNQNGGYMSGGSSPSASFKSVGDQLSGIGGHLGEPEHGEWEYVVVDSKGMSLRESPTYDKSHKVSRRIEEGEVVEVVERIQGDGTTFLRLERPHGWVFDRQPGSKQALRMMEIKVQRGLWHYFVVADKGVALRGRCSFAESAKIGKGPLKGALVEVTERVRAGESTFLRLKEGGWLFDVKNGKKVVEGPVEMQVLPASTMGTVRAQGALGNNCSGGIHLVSSPTKQKWAITKLFLLHNSKVQITYRCEAEGICWICVKKGEGGVEGWATSESILLEGSFDESAASKAPPSPTNGNGNGRMPQYGTWRPLTSMQARSEEAIPIVVGAVIATYPAVSAPAPWPSPSPPHQQQEAPAPPAPCVRGPSGVSAMGLQVCSCGAPFFDAATPFCRTCGSRRPDPTHSGATQECLAPLDAQRPLADALRAGFKKQERQTTEAFGHVNCLGCGLTISKLGHTTGCCKGCGKRWTDVVDKVAGYMETTPPLGWGAPVSPSRSTWIT